MKKAISVLGCVLLAFVVFVPLGTIVCLRCGWVLELTSAAAFYLAGTVLALAALILSLRANPVDSVPIAWIYAVTALLSIVGLLFAAVLYCDTPLAVVFAMLTTLCCIGLAIMHVPSRTLRIIGIVLSMVLMIPAAYMTFLMLLFGNIGCRTVIQTATSPNGAYYAELIDDDQGALGGNTEVLVRDNWCFDGLFFNVTEQSRVIYHGKWGEFKDMAIRWKDDRCLLINEKEYPIE
jgi:hypothetical protein